MTTDVIAKRIEEFGIKKAAHTAQMLKLNDIDASITRCEKERNEAIESGQEAETSWRTRFRSLRGAITPEMRAEHSQRIASRELAEEFTALIDDLEVEKQSEMLGAVSTAKAYVNAHNTAFTEYAESQWNAAMRNISPTLLRAIKLKLMAMKLSDLGENSSPVYEKPQVILSRLTGEMLTKTAEAVQFDMEGEPVLTQLGLHRPALSGVDMRLYNSPGAVHKLRHELKTKSANKENK